MLLVHPGGPFWAKRDLGAWSIPKGECEEGEDPRAAAWREFGEELGTAAPEGEALELGEVRQKAGKIVRGVGASPAISTPSTITSNTFTMEWPPRSGRAQRVPGGRPGRVVRAREARERINPAQVALLDRLARRWRVRPAA